MMIVRKDRGSGRWIAGALVSTATALVLILASSAWAKPAYFVQADIVRGAVGAMGAVCVPNSIFKLGEEIIWRANVYDAETGEALTQDQIDAKGLKVYGELDGGVKVPLEYGAHPPGAPQQELYWAGPWQIPADYATGQYGWSVAVEDSAGNTATYTPLGASAGLSTLDFIAADTTAAPNPMLEQVVDTAPDGENLFATNCAACHQANGSGVPNAFPPLAKNELVAAKDPTFPIRVVLYGLQGKITVAGGTYDGNMPAWSNVFNDAQIAAILTYVRSNFGNDAPAVDAAAVAAQRAIPGTAADNYSHYPH